MTTIQDTDGEGQSAGAGPRNDWDWPSVLEDAEAASRSRGEAYGPPHENIAAIARLWTAYVRNATGTDAELRPGDVAQMMVLLKIGRYQTGATDDRDNFVDEAGYARVAAVLEGVNRDE